MIKSKDYVKGDRLTTPKELVQWLATGKPYYYKEILFEEHNATYYSNTDTAKMTFKAVPKPVEKEIYVYVSCDEVKLASVKFSYIKGDGENSEQVFNYLGKIILDSHILDTAFWN